MRRAEPCCRLELGPAETASGATEGDDYGEASDNWRWRARGGEGSRMLTSLQRRARGGRKWLGAADPTTMTGGAEVEDEADSAR